MIKKSLAVAWKELQVLFKDRGQLAVLFLMPLMFASIIGSISGGGTPGFAVYLVNQDAGPYSTQIAEILYEIEALRIEELDTVEEADRQVGDGEALAAFCQTYVRWQAAEEFLDQHGDVYPVRDERGRIKYMQQFPQVSIARHLLLILKSFYQEFGMTPASRTY